MDGSSEQRSKICENPDISKAQADISFEMKVALGRKNDYYLTGYRQPWIRGASSGTEIIRGTQAAWEKAIRQRENVFG